ncbi:MAG: hypothetical protein OHK0028_14950 [Deltaproteobacteria bacterium]
MDETRVALEPLLDEKYFKAVVLRALDFRGDASREALQDLKAAIQGSGLVVRGYRDPVQAPTAYLAGEILRMGENTEVLAAILNVWMESQAERVQEVKEHLSRSVPAGTDGTKDVMETARSLQERHPEVPLGDAALMIMLLGATDSGEETHEEGGLPTPRSGKERTKERRERKIEREREKAQGLKEEIRTLKAEKEEKDRRIASLEREVRELLRRIRTLEEEKEQAVDARVRDAERKLLLDYCSPAERETYERAENDLESAIECAQRALDRQRATNRRMGSILEVRERYHRVCDLIEELEKVKDESILVVPEVDAAIRRLGGVRKVMLQDATLSRILSNRDSKPPVALALSRIRDLEAAKSSLPVLERAIRLVYDLKACGLLDEAGCNSMRDAIDRKIGGIVLKEGMGAGPPPSSSGTFDDDVLSGRLKGKDLVIDGNNVLLTVLQPEGETQVPDFKERREGFNLRIAGMGHAFRHVHVVYDGFENAVRTDGNVSIIYTDKQGANASADDRIADIIRALSDKAAVLATNDRLLIDRCPKVYRVLSAKDCFDFFNGPGARGR